MAEGESEWAAEHSHELVTPALDPNGLRLTVLVFNLQQSPEALRRAVANLATKQPVLKEQLAKTIRAEIDLAALREELLQQLV